MTALTLARPQPVRKHSHMMSWRKITKLPVLLPRRRTSDPNCANAVINSENNKFSIADLPSELVRGIVSYLDFTDVKTLRLVNREFNELVTGPSSEVVRHWATYELNHIPRHLSRPTASEADWQHIMGQTRRWEMADALAKELVQYSQYRTQLHHNAQRNLRHPPLAIAVKDKLTALIFTLSDYLSRTRLRLMQLSSEDDISVECQAHLDAQTVALLDQTSLEDIQLLHGTWLFLMNVLNIVLARPTYAGTVERTVRGWNVDPLDRCTLAKVLVFGNISAVRRILSMRDYTERKKWARHSLKSLDPELNPHWAEKWAKIDVGLGPVPSEAQARKATRMDVHMHCLWVQGAKLILDKAGGEHVLSPEHLKPSNDNTLAFLSSLAGLDLVNTPVSLIGSGRSGNNSSRSSTVGDD